jgi:hypothetical protein
MNSKSEFNCTHERPRTTFVTHIRSRRGSLLLIATLFVGVSTHFVLAHSSPQAVEPAKIAGTIKANADALKTFTHQQRMQLQLKGETKKVTINQITYDASGNQQKTLVSEDPPADAPPSGGRLKQRVVAKKKGEFKDMMEDIATLIKSYTELPPDRMQAALKQGAFSQGQGDMQGAIQIQMNNVNQQGDSFTLWIDQKAMLFRRAVIATTYEGNPVTVTANYAMLPSGQVYMAQAVLNYPKKEVVVQIDNLNYQKVQ